MPSGCDGISQPFWNFVWPPYGVVSFIVVTGSNLLSEVTGANLAIDSGFKTTFHTAANRPSTSLNSADVAIVTAAAEYAPEFRTM